MKKIRFDDVQKKFVIETDEKDDAFAKEYTDLLSDVLEIRKKEAPTPSDEIVLQKNLNLSDE